MKTSIRAKWIVSTAVAIMAIMIVGGIGMAGLVRLKASLDSAIEHEFRPVAALAEANRALIAWNRSLLNHILAQTPKEKEYFRQRIARHKNDFLSLMDRFPYGDDSLQKARAQIRNINEDLRVALEIQEKVTALSDESRDEEAWALLRSQLRPVIDDIDAGMGWLVDFHEARLRNILAQVERENRSLVQLILAIIAIVSVSVFFVVNFLSGRTVRAIREIDRIVRRVAAGDVGTRIGISSNDEIGFLADEINDMIAKRKKAQEFREEMLRTVSHELRTPLAIMKEGVSVVLDKTAGDINQAQSNFLGIVQSNIDRLLKTTNDMLDLARMEACKDRINRERINVRNLVKESGLLFEPKLKAKNLELRILLPEKELYVDGDKDKISRVLVNLIGNALKFTQKGHIGISVEEKEKEIEFCVSDTGAGIPKEDLPKVFEKFQKFYVANDTEKGSGLGLSIVKAIIEMHRGRVWLQSEPGQGTKAFFTLPKARQRAA